METELSFTKCPNCGGEHTLADDVLQKEIEKGRMAKETKAFLFQHQSIIAKPTGWLSAPIITTFYDVCVDCGTVRCTHAKIGTAVAGGKNLPGMQPPTQFSRS